MTINYKNMTFILILQLNFNNNNSFNIASYWQTSYFLPKDARPYRTPVAKAMAFPIKVVKEKLKNTGTRAILKISNQGGSQRESKNKSQSIILLYIQ